MRFWHLSDLHLGRRRFDVSLPEDHRLVTGDMRCEAETLSIGGPDGVVSPCSGPLTMRPRAICIVSGLWAADGFAIAERRRPSPCVENR